MPVITISRALGSGGAAIARQVARRLRYRYFDQVGAQGSVPLKDKELLRCNRA